MLPEAVAHRAERKAHGFSDGTCLAELITARTGARHA
jgi:hypothetical protein